MFYCYWILILLLIVKIQAQKRHVYDTTTPYYSQILYTKTKSILIKDSYILKPIEESSNHVSEPLYRKVYFKHLQPSYIGFKSLFHSFEDISDENVHVQNLNREQMEFMAWEVLSFPNPDRVLQLIQINDFLFSQIVHSQKLTAMLLDTFELSYEKNPTFFTHIIESDIIDGELWIEIILKSKKSNNYKCLDEILHQKSTVLGKQLIQIFKQQDYTSAWRIMENSNILKAISSQVLNEIRPDIILWVGKSPFAFEYFIDVNTPYVLSSLDWQSIIKIGIKDQNYHLLKAIVKANHILDKLSYEESIKPIIRLFNQYPKDRQIIQIIQIFSQDHNLDRVKGEKWLEILSQLLENGVQFPASNQIIETILSNEEIMKKSDQLNFNRLCSTIFNSKQLSLKWLPFMLREYIAKRFNFEEWEDIIYNYIKMGDDESVRMINESPIVLEIVDYQSQKNLVNEFKYANILASKGIPEHLSRFGGMLGTHLENTIDNAKSSIDDFKTGKILPNYFKGAATKDRSKKTDIESSLVFKTGKMPKIPFVKARKNSIIAKNFAALPRIRF